MVISMYISGKIPKTTKEGENLLVNRKGKIHMA